MLLKVAKTLALVLTVLAFMPASAHLLELYNKIRLPRDDCFVAQGLYRGWALFGFAWVGAMAANMSLAAALWRRRRYVPTRLALAAGSLVALSLAVFSAWTYPASLATENWTRVPEGWEALLRQRECSHAANAVLLSIALVLVTLSVALDDKGGGRA